MPAISTRFPTSTTRSTYSPSTAIESCRKTTYSSSSSSRLGSDTSFRTNSFTRANGNDTSSTSSRFGVSRFSSTTTNSSIPTTRTIPSLLTRKSIDRDYTSKPPVGTSRFRSENNRITLQSYNGYSSLNTKNLDSSQSLNTTKRSPITSLARSSLATSGADLYEKYSVANYKPNCELSRSRSLTDSKLIDSLSASHSPTRRSTSRDRTSASGSLLAGNSSTRDYFSKRSSSPAAQVKPSDGDLSVISKNLRNSRCLYSNNKNSTLPSTNLISNLNNNSNSNNNDSNNNINNNIEKLNNLNGQLNDSSITNNNSNNHHNNNNNVNNNNNINNSKNNSSTLINSNVVSVASITNSAGLNTNKNPKKTQISSANVDTNKCIKGTQTSINLESSAAVIKNFVNKRSDVITNDKTTENMNKYESKHGFTMNNINNNNESKIILSSESFKRRLGTNPLSPYKNPDFLKCEYDLARSQVINSRSKSACSEKVNNNTNNSIGKTTNGLIASSITSTSAQDLNRNKITVSNTTEIRDTVDKIVPTVGRTNHKSLLNNSNSNSSENMNVNYAQHPVDLLDEIKFIDSDESERKHSPSTMNVATLKEFFSDGMPSGRNMKNSTLPSAGAAKKLNDIYSNKYNTISNGNCVHQINIQLGNGIARKAVQEDMFSSTSSSASTISTMTESSPSSIIQKSIIKEPSVIKINNFDKGDNVSNSTCMRAAQSLFTIIN